MEVLASESIIKRGPAFRQAKSTMICERLASHFDEDCRNKGNATSFCRGSRRSLGGSEPYSCLFSPRAPPLSFSLLAASIHLQVHAPGLANPIMLSTRRFLSSSSSFSASSTFSSLLSTRLAGSPSTSSLLRRPPPSSSHELTRAYSSARLTPQLLSLSTTSASRFAASRPLSTLPTPSDSPPDSEATTKRNEQIKQPRQKNNPTSLLQFIAAESEAFAGSNLRTAWIFLARPQGGRADLVRDPRFVEFLAFTARRLAEADSELGGDARSLATVARAVAQIAAPPEDVAAVVETFVARGEAIGESGDPQTLANFAWAFANLNAPAPLFFSALERRGEWFAESGTAKQLANVMWACAKVGVEAPALFSAIAKRGEWLATNGQHRNVATTAWAFAKLGVQAPSFFSAIERRGDQFAKERKLRTKDLCYTAWAFATLGVPAPRFLRALDERGEWLVQNGNSQVVADAEWAFSQLEVDAPTLRKAIRERDGSAVAGAQGKAGKEQEIRLITDSKRSEEIRLQDSAVADAQRKAGKEEELKLNNEINALWERGDTFQLLEFIAAEGSAFSSMNLRTAWHSLSAMQAADRPELLSDPRFTAFIASTEQQIEDDPKVHRDAMTLSTIIHAVAKLGVPATDAMGIIDGVLSKGLEIALHGAPQNVADTAWAFATLGVPAPLLFEAIDKRGAWLVRRGSSEDVAKTLEAFATLDVDAPMLRKAIPVEAQGKAEKEEETRINNEITACKKSGDMFKLLQIIAKESEAFKGVNLRTAWNSLAAMPARDRPELKSDPRFAAFIASTEQQIEDNPKVHRDAKTLSTIIHAIAKLGVPWKDVRGISEQVRSRGTVIAEKGSPQSVANTCWAFAKLGVGAPLLFDVIAKNGAWMVENGNGVEVSNTAWACGKLGVQAPSLFHAIDKQGKSLVQNWQPQAVADTAWAFATLGVSAPLFFEAIEQRGEWLVENGSSRTVANTAWACAKLGFPAPLLFSAIDKKGWTLVHFMDSQNLASTAWACAALGIKAPSLFHAINVRGEWLGKHGKPQEVASAAWAFAKLGVEAPILFAAIERKGRQFVKNPNNAQPLATVAWAFGRLGFPAPRLFNAIDLKGGWLVERLVESKKPQAVANTAWAFATLGIAAPSLFGAIEKRGEWLVENGTSQSVATTAWACAKLGADAPTFRKAIQQSERALLDEADDSEFAFDGVQGGGSTSGADGHDVKLDDEALALLLRWLETAATSPTTAEPIAAAAVEEGGEAAASSSPAAAEEVEEEAAEEEEVEEQTVAEPIEKPGKSWFGGW